MPLLVKRPPAELVIRRPNGVECRIVRHDDTQRKNRMSQRTSVKIGDEYARKVQECPPYTASFNALLEAELEKISALTSSPSSSSSLELASSTSVSQKHSVRESTSKVDQVNFNSESKNEVASKVMDKLSAVNASMLHLVQLAHTRMHAEAIPLNTTTYNTLMRLVLGCNDETVFTLYEEFKLAALQPHASVLPDHDTYRTLFRACERRAMFERAFVFYEHMRRYFHLLPDTPTYNTLLGYCAGNSDVAQAKYFMNEMKQNKVPRDISTYNCYMNTLVNVAPYSELIDVFYELGNVHLVADIRTYNTILQAARVHDDYDRAFQLFEEMKRKGLLPDLFTYNTLLSVCEQRVHYVLGTGAYSNLSRVPEQIKHGKNTLAELVLCLLSEMKALNVQPNTYTYNVTLRVLLKCNNYRLFTIYRNVVDAYPASLKRSKHKMKKQINKDNRYDNEQDRKGNKQSITETEMDKVKCNSNNNIQNANGDTVLSCHDNNTEGDSWKGCEHQVNSKTQLESQENLNTTDCTRLAEGAAQQTKKSRAEAMYKHRGDCVMRAEGVLPHLDTYAIMLEACLAMGKAKQCTLLYNDMCSYGFALRKDVLFHLLRACAALCDWEWAVQLMEEARVRHVNVSTVECNAFLSVFAACIAVSTQNSYLNNGSVSEQAQRTKNKEEEEGDTVHQNDNNLKISHTCSMPGNALDVTESNKNNNRNSDNDKKNDDCKEQKYENVTDEINEFNDEKDDVEYFSKLSMEFEKMKLGINVFGARADINTYNIMLSALVKMKKLAEAQEMLAKMLHTFNSSTSIVTKVTSTGASDNNKYKMKECQEECAELSLEPNDETFCLMIDLYAEVGDVNYPTRVLEERLQRGAVCGICVFHHWLHLYATFGDNRILLLFNQLRSHKMTFTNVSDEVNSTEDNDNTNIVVKVEKEKSVMERKIELPDIDVECYCVVMTYLLEYEKKYKEVLSLFNELKTSNVLQPDTQVYEIVFHMYSMLDDKRALIALFDDARLMGVKLDVTTYNHIYRCFISSATVDKSSNDATKTDENTFLFDVLYDMQNNSVAPAESTIALFASTSRGRQLLNEIVSRGLFTHRKVVDHIDELFNVNY